MMFSSGAPVLRRDYAGAFYERLEVSDSSLNLERLNNGAPLLDSHRDGSLSDVIGKVERAWIEGSEAMAEVRFANTEAGNLAMQLVKDGIVNSVSVGYRIDEMRDDTKDGENVRTYTATKWTPFELSAVSLPAEIGAGFRNENVNETYEVEITTPETIATTNVAENETRMNKTESETAILAERKRASEIRTAVRTARLDDSFADEMIDQGVSADAARASVLQKMSEQPMIQAHNTDVRSFSVGSSNFEKRRDAMVEAIAHRADKTMPLSNDARQFAGLSLLGMVERHVGRQLGESEASLAKRAMSTSDFPLLLSNAGEKILQARYKVSPRSYKTWCGADSLRNYKPTKSLRSGDLSSLVEREEGAEFTYGSMGEEQELVQLKDYGKMFAFTSQAIVNDDLRALQMVMAESAATASRLENRKANLALSSNPTMADGVALFHATHGNLMTAAAINETSLAEGFKLMRKQRSVNAEELLNLRPATLIVGPDKEVEARRMVTSISAVSSSTVNPFGNAGLELCVDAELTGSQWYLAANPNEIGTVTMFTLDGNSMPSIQNRVNWNTNSLELKIEHTIAAAAVDWRGIVKNAGA